MIHNIKENNKKYAKSLNSEKKRAKKQYMVSHWKQFLDSMNMMIRTSTSTSTLELTVVGAVKLQGNICLCSFSLQAYFDLNFMNFFCKKSNDTKNLLFWNFSFCDPSQLFYLGPESDFLGLFIRFSNRPTHWSYWDLIDVSLYVDDAGSKVVEIVVVNGPDGPARWER